MNINLPLVDKYKPKKLDQLILPEHIYNKIDKIIKRKHIINTIIIGPNGVGKSIILQILTKGILCENFDNACLNLNTTNYRGLKDLQNL
jgi:DNA polymerase III gamma/tau subunit